MLKLFEPLWAKKIFIFMYTSFQQNIILYTVLPICADIFVFIYPLYLVVVYLWGILKKEYYYKHAGVSIFFSTLISSIINIIGIQSFFEKPRPNVFFGLQTSESGETILHKYLPSSSFPSDHATVSMAIAIATLLWGIRYNDRKFKFFGYFLIGISLLMSFSRVAVGVHWFTDIIAGLFLGIIIPLILSRKPISDFLEKLVYSPLIKLQEFILKR